MLAPHLRLSICIIEKDKPVLTARIGILRFKISEVMLGPSHEACPPFPSDLPTAGLLSISLGQLQENSSSESGKLFAACQDLGFFYLDLTDSDLGKAIIDNAEHLHLLQQHFYSLPHKSKDDFGQDKVDPFFAYRWTGCEGDVKDAWGRPGRREMYSVRSCLAMHECPELCLHGADAGRRLRWCTLASSTDTPLDHRASGSLHFIRAQLPASGSADYEQP